LANIRGWVAAGDGAALEDLFSRAREARQHWIKGK